MRKLILKWLGISLPELENLIKETKIYLECHNKVLAARSSDNRLEIKILAERFDRFVQSVASQRIALKMENEK